MRMCPCREYTTTLSYSASGCHNSLRSVRRGRLAERRLRVKPMNLHTGAKSKIASRALGGGGSGGGGVSGGLGLFKAAEWGTHMVL